MSLPVINPFIKRYDRQWNELTDYDDIEKLLSNREYRVVSQDYVVVWSSKYFVSTVRLWLDHNFKVWEKHIFETMVFIKEWEDILSLDNYQERYNTEEDSIKWHKHIIDSISLKYGNYKLTIKED